MAPPTGKMNKRSKKMALQKSKTFKRKAVAKLQEPPVKRRAPGSKSRSGKKADGKAEAAARRELERGPVLVPNTDAASSRGGAKGSKKPFVRKPRSDGAGAAAAGAPAGDKKAAFNPKKRRAPFSRSGPPRAKKPRVLTKEEKKELRKKRLLARPGGEAADTLKSIFAENISSLPATERAAVVERYLSETKPQAVLLASKKDSGRVLRILAKYGTRDQLLELTRALKGGFTMLAQHRSGSQVVLSILKHGNAPVVDLVVAEVLGHVKTLSLHATAYRVMDLLFSGVASPAQRRRLLQELYHDEYKVLPVLNASGKPCDLGAILHRERQDAAKTARIWANLERVLSQAVDRHATSTVTVHTVLHQFLVHCPLPQESTGVAFALEHALQLANSRPGCWSLALAYSFASAKQRRKFLQALRDHVATMALDKDAWVLLVRAMQITDDTKQVDKLLLRELVAHLTDTELSDAAAIARAAKADKTTEEVETVVTPDQLLVLNPSGALALLGVVGPSSFLSMVPFETRKLLCAPVQFPTDDAGGDDDDDGDDDAASEAPADKTAVTDGGAEVSSGRKPAYDTRPVCKKDADVRRDELLDSLLPAVAPRVAQYTEEMLTSSHVTVRLLWVETMRACAARGDAALLDTLLRGALATLEAHPDMLSHNVGHKTVKKLALVASDIVADLVKKGEKVPDSNGGKIMTPVGFLDALAAMYLESETHTMSEWVSERSSFVLAALIEQTAAPKAAKSVRAGCKPLLSEMQTSKAPGTVRLVGLVGGK